MAVYLGCIEDIFLPPYLVGISAGGIGEHMIDIYLIII
jgi:uncharacterized membrane protein YqaE (UPF0057 family)